MEPKLIIFSSLILFHFVVSFWVNSILFRLGRYIKKTYPDRYQKQLTSSKPFITEFFSATWQLPFPYNLGRFQHNRLSNLKKVLTIAEIENDNFLLSKVKNFGPIIKWSGLFELVIILTVVFLYTRFAS